MSKPRKSRGSSSPTASTPLKGALHVDGETKESVALQMVLERIDAMQRQQTLEAQARERTMAKHAHEISAIKKQFDQQMVAEKHRAAQALLAVQEKFQKLIEANPMDPKMRADMIKAAMLESNKKRIAQHARFKEDVANMPKGEVFNPGPPEFLTINGITVWFKHGKNTVPSCFVEQWKKREHMQAMSASFAQSLQATKDGPLEANKVQGLIGKLPAWNEEIGGAPL